MKSDDIINARYRLIRPMQTTWLAEDQIGGRHCLIRRARDFIDPTVADWLGRVWHPGLPRLLEQLDPVGSDPLLVFEYREGEPLSQLADREREWAGQSRLVLAVAKAARILSFLHQQGDQPILHLDIKPDHILIDDQGQVCLIDFGAARRMSCGTTDGSKPVLDKQALTPEFAAPEQMAGHPCPGSDLYALGLTLLHLLTGLQPSDCRSQPIHRIGENLPYGLQRILGRCLQSEPADRYIDAEELACDLEQACLETTDCNQTESDPPIQGHEVQEPHQNCDDDSQPAHLVCVWDGAEFGCELAAALGENQKVLVVDADLLNPRADLLLGLIPARAAIRDSQTLAGLDLAISRQQRGYLDIAALGQLIQTTRVRNVFALTTHAGLEHYDHFDLDSLYQILRLSRLTFDTVIMLCSRFIYDAYTCLCLQAASLVLIPLSGDSAAFRERKRSIEYLAARQQLDFRKISFAAFPYDPVTDLSRGTLDELSGGRLAGCISDSARRRSQKSGALPYAAGIDRHNLREYGNLVRKLHLDKAPGKKVNKCRL